MKGIYNYLPFIMSAFVLFSCKQDDQYLFYDSPAYIQFGPEYSWIYTTSYNFSDTLKTYSSYYEPETVTEADVLFDVYAIGGPRDYDRRFELRQINVEGAVNAVPGVHYVPFDSESMRSVHVIPAGEVHLQVPIRVMRTESGDFYTLQFELVENENFLLGDEKLLWRRLVFTSALQKPLAWDMWKGYFGIYSKIKHEFMIEMTGLKWDNEFFEEITTDYGALVYWGESLMLILNRINGEREAQGLDKLSDENGYISFP